MINELDETLRQLLITKGELATDRVRISFDIPTREWSSAPVMDPTVNLYLYDVRENTRLRESLWNQESVVNGHQAQRKPRPLRIDLSYMITTWAGGVDDQHLLLWRVLETFFRHSPLPEDVLQGNLRQLLHPIRTEVAQPEGILKNVSDFWGALENQLRPAVNLLVTVDLDLNEIVTRELVFARIVKTGRRVVKSDRDGRERALPRLDPGWEVLPLRVAGVVRDEQGDAVEGAAVRLVGVRGGRPSQVGPTSRSDAQGRYVLDAVPPGEYTLVVEPSGGPPQQHALVLMAGERGEPLPEFVHEVRLVTS
jgi:hypothetical protein